MRFHFIFQRRISKRRILEADQPEKSEAWQDVVENDTGEIEINPEQDDAAEDDPLSVLIAERDQLKDQLLRAMAETENMRRRTEREMQSARKYNKDIKRNSAIDALSEKE